MHGYLSLDIICSSKLALSEQTMSADKYPSIFSRQMDAIVYIAAQGDWLHKYEWDPRWEMRAREGKDLSGWQPYDINEGQKTDTNHHHYSDTARFTIGYRLWEVSHIVNWHGILFLSEATPSLQRDAYKRVLQRGVPLYSQVTKTYHFLWYTFLGACSLLFITSDCKSVLVLWLCHNFRSRFLLNFFHYFSTHADDVAFQICWYVYKLFLNFTFFWSIISCCNCIC